MHYGIMMVRAGMFMVIHIVFSYTLFGKPVEEQDNPKNGMVIDFSDLKRIVKKEIVDVFDHSVVVSRQFD